jgi:hypothetical protein
MFTPSVESRRPKIQPINYPAARSQANFLLTSFMFLLFLIEALRCPAQVPQLFSPPKEQWVRRIHDFIFDLRQSDSATFALTVDSIRQLAKEKGDERAGLYARLFLAEGITERHDYPPLSATALLREKGVFEGTPFLDVKASYYILLGQVCDRWGNYEEMFHYLIAATDLFEKIGWRNAPLVYADYLFSVYYRYEDYVSALRFVKIALDHLDPKSGIYDFRLSNMGETYLRLKDIPRAQAIFQQVIQTAKANGDTAYIGIASGHYGNTLRLKGRYFEALPYLYLDVALNEKKVPEHSAIACAHIAVCLVHLDSLYKAEIYLQKAARLRQEWNWYSFFPPYYEASTLYWKRRGDYRQASLYQDSLLIINNLLRERFNTSLLLTTSLTLKEGRRLADQRQKELETARLQLTRNLVIGLLVFLFSAVLVMLLRKRRKERERSAAQQQETEERLHKAEDELAQYISTIKEKNKLIEQIEARLHRREEPLAGPEEVALQHLQNLAILTEEDWLKFKVLFTAVWPGFFDGLPSRYPDLTQGEVRLLALCKLELSSKEMAAMLGISQDSLRKSRYRLRKKYQQLTEDEDFKHII